MADWRYDVIKQSSWLCVDVGVCDVVWKIIVNVDQH